MTAVFHHWSEVSVMLLMASSRWRWAAFAPLCTGGRSGRHPGGPRSVASMTGVTLLRGGNTDNPSVRPGTKPDWTRRMWATWLDIMALLLAIVPFVGLALGAAAPARPRCGAELTPAGGRAAWSGSP